MKYGFDANVECPMLNAKTSTSVSMSMPSVSVKMGGMAWLNSKSPDNKELEDKVGTAGKWQALKRI